MTNRSTKDVHEDIAKIDRDIQLYMHRIAIQVMKLGIAGTVTGAAVLTVVDVIGRYSGAIKL